MHLRKWNDQASLIGCIKNLCQNDKEQFHSGCIAKFGRAYEVRYRSTLLSLHYSYVYPILYYGLQWIFQYYIIMLQFLQLLHFKVEDHPWSCCSPRPALLEDCWIAFIGIKYPRISSVHFIFNTVNTILYHSNKRVLTRWQIIIHYSSV